MWVCARLCLARTTVFLVFYNFVFYFTHKDSVLGTRSYAHCEPCSGWAEQDIIVLDEQLCTMPYSRTIAAVRRIIALYHPSRMSVRTLKARSVAIGFHF